MSTLHEVRKDKHEHRRDIAWTCIMLTIVTVSFILPVLLAEARA